MATIRMNVRARRIPRLFGLVFAGALAGFALATCGDDPGADEPAAIETETHAEALSRDQCRYFTQSSGKTRICHYDSYKRKFLPKDVDQAGCCSHTSHSKDYVAQGDPNCVGGGCIPLGAPCDNTLKCCTGTTCSNGKCAPAACVPTGMRCQPLIGAPCCSGGGAGCTCADPQNPTNCFCP